MRTTEMRALPTATDRRRLPWNGGKRARARIRITAWGRLDARRRESPAINRRRRLAQTNYRRVCVRVCTRTTGLPGTLGGRRWRRLECVYENRSQKKIAFSRVTGNGTPLVTIRVIGFDGLNAGNVRWPVCAQTDGTIRARSQKQRRKRKTV